METTFQKRKVLRKAEKRRRQTKNAVTTGTTLLLGIGFAFTSVLPATADTTEEWDRLAEDVLAEIEVRDTTDDSVEYDRDTWERGSQSWWDADGTGCTTQEDILIRDTDPSTQVLDEGDDCRLVFGMTQDPFNAQTVTHDRSAVDFNRTPFDIDHLVSLHDAHYSGGHAWTPEQKQEFSQDKDNLLAVEASENRSKGSRTLSGYLPPEQGQYCDFVGSVIHVKAKYNLSMTAEDYRVATDILATQECENTVAAPAVTMTENYRNAQADAEPTDETTETPAPEPTDEPTQEPSDDPTETPEPSDTPTVEPSEEPTVAPSATQNTPEPDLEIQPVESLEPIIVDEGTVEREEDRRGFAQDRDDAEINGEIGIQPIEPLEPIILDRGDDDRLVRNFDNDGLVLSDQERADLSEEDNQEIERLADAGAGDWTAWLAAGSLAAIGVGVVLMLRGRAGARNH